MVRSDLAPSSETTLTSNWTVAQGVPYNWMTFLLRDSQSACSYSKSGAISRARIDQLGACHSPGFGVFRRAGLQLVAGLRRSTRMRYTELRTHNTQAAYRQWTKRTQRTCNAVRQGDGAANRYNGWTMAGCGNLRHCISGRTRVKM